jgi:hypothetical protein
VTEKRQLQRESRQIARVDLLAVKQVANLLSRTPRGGRAVRLIGDKPFDDPHLLLLLETGLVVTYARVFTDSRQYTPVPRDWVPADLRGLHDPLLERRESYHAHTDRALTNVHRRHVAEAGAMVSVSFPEALTKAELEGLDRIADELLKRLGEALDLPSPAKS